ncbi:MAG: aminopeptidase [Gammaproteobacteria bacterium]
MINKCLLALILLISSSLNSGCSTIGYYSQSIQGQLSVMSKRVSIDELIEDPATSDQKKAVLRNILQIREFASDYLHLPDNESYSTYVDLDEDYVVWNVFATPEFSLTPVSSCFLIVGCLQYKGFFAKQDAIDFADELRESGNDVFVGGVTAYSTLGWFDDPILSSMLTYGEFRLAEVIFHELAHQLIYIKNDSAFNEAFATAIGEIGVRRWLQENNRDADLEKFNRDKQWDYEFIQIVLSSKEKLDLLFGSDQAKSHDQKSQQTPEQLRIKKQTIYDELRTDYSELKSAWENPPNYDNWMQNDLNNAKVASIVTYHDLTESFGNLLALSNNNLHLFYQRVRHLGSLSELDRHSCLEDMSIQTHCYAE